MKPIKFYILHFTFSILPLVAVAGSLDQSLFETPAHRNRPETWFHIIGGNVTREGLTADLEAIAGAGIGGIQFFHGQFGGPWPNVPKQIQCLSPEWDSLVTYAADECKRLGLSFKMQNCPGWSMSGGPWIPPSKAMRKLTYSRSDVETADGHVKASLKPSHDPANRELDYKDVAVLAFPTPADDVEAELKPVRTTRKDHVYTMIYDNPVTVRTFTVPSPNQLNHGHAYNIKTKVKLEAIDEDGTARTVREVDMPQACWQDPVPMSLACEEATSRIWRVSYDSQYPTAINTHWGARLYSSARFDNWEGRASWTLRGLGWEQNPKQNPASRVKADEIVDLTGQLAKDGTLEAKLPHAGKWTLLRFGHVNMRKRNSPAPKEGTGWECDKLDPKGAEAQYAGYIGRLAKGPLKGKIKGVLLDSWECERQTWTSRMEELFRNANGYEVRRKLPAVFGWILDTPEATDKFLLDWRNTLGALCEENFYRRMGDLAREDGLEIQYETAFGDVLPGDILKFWKYADTPMTEFWAPHRNNGYVGDHDFKPVMPCVSAAHLYGKPRVAAEAFTSFELTWNENFRLLQNVGNKHFARGVTHCVFHTYTHNPQVNWKKPGTSFGSGIGTPFLRGQTWWPFMRNFTDWLARINVMLESGRASVDVLRYLGDYVGHKPSEHEEPFGNKFKIDYLNFDGLATRVSVKDGRWVYPDGTSYSVLWIPTGTYLAPKSAALIDAFEKQGGRVVRGDDPTKGLMPDVSTGDILWNHRTDGRRDWYFVATKADGFKGDVTFRAKGAAEIWDPVTGKTAPAVRKGEAVALDLAPDQAVFVVFDSGRSRGSATLPGGTRSCASAKLGAWTLALGSAAPTPLAELVPWRDLPGASAEVRAFSGTGVYRTTVTVEREGACTLDLGEVEAWARVFVNGKLAATLWGKPYRCEIGELLKRGANELRVEVTSTWHNRLVYDASQPEDKRQTWVIAGPKAEAALKDSGLLGPVSISADPESVKAAMAVVAIDRTTQGQWCKRYGKAGYCLCGNEDPALDVQQLPEYVESVAFTLSGGQPSNRSSQIKPIDAKARLPQARDGKGEAKLGCCYSDLHGTMEVLVKFRKAHPGRVSLYVADCDRGGRAVKVTAFDSATGKRLAPAAKVDNFGGGVYLSVECGNSVRFRLDCIGGDNAVVSGVFFE